MRDLLFLCRESLVGEQIGTREVEQLAQRVGSKGALISQLGAQRHMQVTCAGSGDGDLSSSGVSVAICAVYIGQPLCLCIFTFKMGWG